MQEYSSLDSNHSTEELSVQETAPDVFREPEEDEDPLLELLQTQGSYDTEQETGPDRPQQDTATRPRPRGYKTFFMLNTAEHDIYPAHKC